MTRRLGLGTLLATAALVLAACSGSGTTPAPATPAQATPAQATPAQTAPAQASQPPASTAASGCEVVAGVRGTAAEIKGFAFPAALTVKAGEAITWSNADGTTHTVTFDDGSCASGSIAGGTSVTVRYTVPGTYPFHCSIHARMTGTLVVGG